MRPFRTLSAATFPSSAAAIPPASAVQPRSPWHSPVPYLFGGLAAMLGLIAFALLILACSYWRLSGRLSAAEDGGSGDLEGGNEKEGKKLEGKVYEEKILVIMAGNERPTFLATPVLCRECSVGDKIDKIGNIGGAKMEFGEKIKEEFESCDQKSGATSESEEPVS